MEDIAFHGFGLLAKTPVIYTSFEPAFFNFSKARDVKLLFHATECTSKPSDVPRRVYIKEDPRSKLGWPSSSKPPVRLESCTVLSRNYRSRYAVRPQPSTVADCRAIIVKLNLLASTASTSNQLVSKPGRQIGKISYDLLQQAISGPCAEMRSTWLLSEAKQTPKSQVFTLKTANWSHWQSQQSRWAKQN